MEKGERKKVVKPVSKKEIERAKAVENFVKILSELDEEDMNELLVEVKNQALELQLLSSYSGVKQ